MSQLATHTNPNHHIHLRQPELSECGAVLQKRRQNMKISQLMDFVDPDSPDPSFFKP